MDEEWDKIPSSTDILVTHCPPLSTLDTTKKGIQGGDMNLARHVEERVKPILH